MLSEFLNLKWLTGAWNQGRPYGWGNLYGKYEYLQVHRYKSADALQDGSQWHLEEENWRKYM